MEVCKKIKDPVYGYIEIGNQYIEQVVDTPTFQRLRRVSQTSYTPLYPSSLHNRFVHSLGVYHLGSIACEALKSELNRKNVEYEASLLEIFLLACLLHDVGHAPFSHTGEYYYLDDNKGYDILHDRLIELVGNDSIKIEIEAEVFKNAAPHEIMSAIVGLSEFGNLFTNVEDREFFARCITGYLYKSDLKNNGYKNCFISLLNSEVIDVDRLDYLIRDAFFTGYNTVSIDHKRLLKSITVVEMDGKTYRVAFKKSAISVIEDVVYAHDSERKWIQTHPTVLYEDYIIKHAMDVLSKQFDSKNQKLFSEQSLTLQGQELEKTKISLFCDDDVVHLMKSNYCNEDSLINEYFNRNARRHPAWKSESEYRAYVNDLISGGEWLDNFKRIIELTSNYISKNTESGVINEDTLKKLDEEIKNIEDSPLDREDKEVQLKEKSAICKVFNALNQYSQNNGVPFDYVLLTASEFNSGFGKPKFSNLTVVFEENGQEKTMKVGDVISSLKPKKAEQDKFFYIFYRKHSNYNYINKNEFCRFLIREVAIY